MNNHNRLVGFFIIGSLGTGCLATGSDVDDSTGSGADSDNTPETLSMHSLSAELQTSVCTGGGREFDLAAESAGPATLAFCRTTTGSRVCFDPFGDRIYVRDTLGDGFSAAARWTSDFGRFGTCRNALGANHWGVCNKNFPENRTITFDATRYDGNTGVCIGPESTRLDAGT